MNRLLQSLLFGSMVALTLVGCSGSESAQTYEQKVVFEATDGLDVRLAKAAQLVPSARQAAWQQHELTAFLHFGINTFTGREWGDGTEDPALFAPTDLDAEQWVLTLKEAGFRLVILTAKHHDGFCLWPTKTTTHSVASSPWRDGKGDVVRELADACHKHGMKLGLYLSPWDRNHPTYGTGEGYNEVYLEQLTELLTQYGQVDEVWFDGANGEGPNGKKQVYDWEAVRQTIARLQPDAVTAIMGQDIRWVGNERGYGRETEWSITALPPGVLPESPEVREQLGLDETSPILFGRDLIAKAPALYWWPSEVDVSIRPGWFYHPEEDSQVKPLSKLAEIYFASVGMNSSLLLNIPPDTRGRLADTDVAHLRQLGDFVRAFESRDAVPAGAKLSVVGDTIICVATDPQIAYDAVVLQEDILRGQHVAAFAVEAQLQSDGPWQKVAQGTTIGYKRILLLEAPIQSVALRLVVYDAIGKPLLSRIAARRVPPTDYSSGSVTAEERRYLQHTTADGTPHAPLTVDLGQAQPVSGFTYAMAADRTADTLPTHYRLEVSHDGLSYQVVSEGELSNIINNPIPITVQLSTPVEARYVRFSGTSRSDQSLAFAPTELLLF